MKSCHDCKYYHAEYGGVCFAQKDAPRVFWQVAETCDDFIYKDAKILLDPISLSKEQVRDIYEVAHVDDIGDVSDGFHTFNQLYHQRAMLFAALVNQNRDISWKSRKHEDGKPCFGGGWFVVTIDTPAGPYGYHYEDKYWDMFRCKELEKAKHWDGYTEEDVGRLMSLPDTAEWIYAVDKCRLFATCLGKNIVKCSKCGNTLDMNGVNAGRGDANFCPNCGKKMNDNGRSKTVPKSEEE